MGVSHLIATAFWILLVCCTSAHSETSEEQHAHGLSGILITPDVVYGRKFGMALTFDVYQPPEPNGAAVIFVNSGGWVSFFPAFYEQTPEGLRLLSDEELTEISPGFYQASFRPFLAEGFSVFAVRHGSSPRFEMPEILDDLRRATRFIRSHADEYGVDAERLGLLGGSAGGHLSLLVGTSADAEKGSRTFGHSGRSRRRDRIWACSRACGGGGCLLPTF